MKTIFKSFKEFLETDTEEMVYNEDVSEQAPDHKKMRDFTYHHVTNTDKDHPTIKKMFVKKFGAQHLKHFNKHVSAIVDQYDPDVEKSE